MLRVRTTLQLLVLASLCVATSAQARPHIRRHFEPTDLELEDPGTVELDLQFGFVRSQDPWRLVAPDYELDLGLTDWLELDADGAYAAEGAPGKSFSFDHLAVDPLWVSLKAGLLDIADQSAGRDYAFGLQLGPKFPNFAGGRGVGVEGLLLAGAKQGRTTLSLNLGGLIDPSPTPGAPRPVAFEGGIACDQDLDATGTWGLGGQLSSVIFASHDPAQLQVAFGPTYSPSKYLDLSLTALAGFLPGSDRYGVLAGVSPHVPLW
jgi:hypothetical protein